MAKKKKRNQKKAVKHLHVLQPNSAGIDIGTTEIYIAVPDDRAGKAVRRFDTLTDDLHDAAKWLKK